MGGYFFSIITSLKINGIPFFKSLKTFFQCWRREFPRWRIKLFLIFSSSVHLFLKNGLEKLCWMKYSKTESRRVSFISMLPDAYVIVWLVYKLFDTEILSRFRLVKHTKKPLGNRVFGKSLYSSFCQWLYNSIYKAFPEYDFSIKWWYLLFEVETNSKLFEDEQTLYYVVQRVFIQH